MMRYSKLGYVALNVTDLARSIDFYRDCVGLTSSGRGKNGEVFLRCSEDHHNIVLYQSQQPGLKRIGWEMEDDDALAQMREALVAAGLTVSEVCEEERGALHQGTTFRVIEPFSGATFEYYSSVRQFAGSPFVPTVAKIARLGHIVLRVPQLREASAFCTSRLNFRTSDVVEGRVHFFRCFPNPFHHSLGLASSAEAGLHHVNFMVTEIDDIGRAIARFKKGGVEVVYGPGRHPPSDSIFLYFLDPDGLTIEYSFGMEEFPEVGARKPRILEAVPESIDFWGAPRDPRTSTFGHIERA